MILFPLRVTTAIFLRMVVNQLTGWATQHFWGLYSLDLFFLTLLYDSWVRGLRYVGDPIWILSLSSSIIRSPIPVRWESNSLVSHQRFWAINWLLPKHNTRQVDWFINLEEGWHSLTLQTSSCCDYSDYCCLEQRSSVAYFLPLRWWDAIR